MPRRVPSDALPSDWAPWVEAARDLPEHFHGEGAREWLEARFAKPAEGVDAVVTTLTESEADRLLTVLSVLGHAYRWDRLPPAAEEYQRQKLVLPPGIEGPWRALASRAGHPRVGNLAAMVTANWRLPGREGGSTYEIEALLDGGAEPAVLWLSPPKDETLRAFVRTGIETEALGARAVLTCVRLVEAASRRNAHRCAWLLERLHEEISAMGRPFKHYVQKGVFTGSDFMTLIQPATLWGIDEGEGVLEGASGPQVGSLQVLDSVLSVARRSGMGKSVVHTRRFLPGRHQRFLEAADAAGPVLRQFVEESGDSQLAGLFNAGLSALKAWRLVHQKRGAAYLRAEGPGAPGAYMSTGGVVALEDERVLRFEHQMTERVAETDAAFVTNVGNVGATLPLRHLGPADMLAVLVAAWRREAEGGTVLLKRGSRGASLYLVHRGEEEVRAPGGEVVAVLGPGEVFGEVSFVDNEPASADVVARGAVAVDVLPREHLHVLCETRPGFAERLHLSLAVLLARRVRARFGD